MGQKGLMVEELEKEVRSEGMVCNIIEVLVRNYKHTHIEIISQSGSVLVEIIDEGHFCFKVRFFEDLDCRQSLYYLSSYLEILESRFDCKFGFSLETKNCYRVWVEEEDS